ncbi:MAG: Anaerobic nitric oxide reductase transcription regulator NorR [bacterium]|nr:Anaerobic nitric oxide reductase transcription regulator NorR [bacterium]
MFLSCGVTTKSKTLDACWSSLLCLNLAATLFAQPTEMRFEHISVEQGLSNFALTKIVQDQQGFLWFGTEDGLNKYDGYQFTVYKPDPADSNSLAGRFIQALHVDRQGKLWVGTGSEGLFQYNPDTDKFDRFKYDPHNPESLAGKFVNTIYEDSRGDLWFGTLTGLYRYNRQSDTFTIYRHDPHDTTTISSDGISAFYEDRMGTLWIGTGAGLNRYEREKNTFIRYRHNPNNPSGLSGDGIVCIREDRRGVIWIGTSSGLNRYDRQTDKITRCRYHPQDPYTMAPDFVFDIYVDSKGTLWVGTFHIGLWRYEAATDRFFNYMHDPDNPYSLSEDRISCLYEDRSGVMWMGTYRHGLNRYDRRQEAFARYQIPRSGGVYAIKPGRNGELWIGTSDAGLLQYDRQGKLAKHYLHDPKNPESLSSNIVQAIYECRHGELWIGTGRGLDLYDARNQRFIHYLHKPFDLKVPEHYEVKAVYEDTAGAIWIGTKGSGLCRLNRQQKTFTYYRNEPDNPASLGGNSIWTISEDKNSDLWIGTFDGGVSRLDKKTGAFVRYRHDPKNPRSLNNNAIYSIYADPSGQIWLGTFGGGLNRYDPDTEVFTHYTERNGLLDNFVKGILPDGHGNLWLSTDKGLSQFVLRPDELGGAGAHPQTASFKNYTVKDGLISNQFLSGAYDKSQDGRLFFGGEGGVIAFHPDSLKDNPHRPPVVLTRFNVFDHPLPLPAALASLQEIKLSYRQNFFSFDFVALDYTAPLKNQYAYQLEGFDPDWVHCGTRRYASYTNVDPGEYVFRVKGANSDGVWNEAGASIQIVITPPFWKTWWFRILAISALFFSGFTWYKRRIRLLEEKRQALEKQVQERTAFAEALQHALNEVESLKNRLEAENVYLQDEIKLEHNFTDIISRSQALKKILGKVEQVAATDATVLILGESGTGKELLARAVHNLSPRRERPMVKVNCAALPANLIESELFGHEKGAFTGAISRKSGRFELANGGTIFLDEIAELPPELQAKLLRVLQEGEFERVGGQQTLKTDTRVIAATHRDLKEEIAHGRFREDLYYRLHVFPITIPPLRERREDIPLLINHFVKKYSARIGKKIETVSQNIIETLQAYDWPGNVRELENVIERAVIVSQGKQLKLDDWLPYANPTADESSHLKLEELERSHIIKILEMTGWRISGQRGAAKILDIKPTTLRSRMEKLGIKR